MKNYLGYRLIINRFPHLFKTLMVKLHRWDENLNENPGIFMNLGGIHLWIVVINSDIKEGNENTK